MAQLVSAWLGLALLGSALPQLIYVFVVVSKTYCFLLMKSKVSLFLNRNVEGKWSQGKTTGEKNRISYFKIHFIVF